MNKQEFCAPEILAQKCNELFSDLPAESKLCLVKIFHLFQYSSKNQQDYTISNSLCLLSKICSCLLNADNKNDPFQPIMTMNGKRSFLPNDLSTEEIDYLTKVLNYIEQPILKSRIADILWCYSSPRNRTYQNEAIQNYIKISISDESFNPDIYQYWKRSAILAKSSKQENLIDNIKETLEHQFTQPSKSWEFHKIEIAKIFLDTNWDKNIYSKLAENLLNEYEESNKNNEINISEQYLTIIQKLFFKAQIQEKAYEAIYLLASSYENHADLKYNENNNIVANYFYKLALQQYRNIPNKYKQCWKILEKMNGLKTKITQSNSGILNELKQIKTQPIDISKLQEHSRIYVANKPTLCEALLYFSGISTTNYQDILKQSKETMYSPILSHIATQPILSSDGRKIEQIEPLNEHNEAEVIFKKSIQYFSTIKIQLTIQGNILPALEQIKEEHIIPKDFLIELCQLSPIIPNGREILIANALYLGFQGDFRTSIHLLAPQVENMIRQLLKKHNEITTRIDEKGIENEIGISTLMDSPETKNILGEDLCFELQAVFTNPIGPNLRNQVAHGLLDDEESDSIYSVYAWWMVLKWIIRSIIKQ